MSVAFTSAEPPVLHICALYRCDCGCGCSAASLRYGRESGSPPASWLVLPATGGGAALRHRCRACAEGRCGRRPSG